MAEINLENITLKLTDENHGVRVKSETENVILSDQTIENISNIIRNNFKIIKSFYESKVAAHLNNAVGMSDIYQVSVLILLHYLYMYNSWRKMYKKHENIDLRFNPQDFDSSTTHDIIFNYFKTKYRDEWEEKCSILIGMSIDQLRTYYKSREAFYNR